MTTQSELSGPKPDWDLPTPGHLLKNAAQAITLLREELVTVRSRLIDYTRPVDEYLPGSGNTAGQTQNGFPSPLTLKADFDTVDELITSIIISTPLTAGIAQQYSGSTAAGPPAGTTVVTSPALTAGDYLVTVQSLYTGTVTFADADNLQIKIGPNVWGTLAVQGSAEFVNTNGPFVLSVPAGQAVSVTTIGVGSGTAASDATLTVTPLNSGGTVTVTLGDRIFSVPPGFVVIPEINLILSKTDTRQLSWTNTGNGYMELMGFAYGAGG